jgi:hypothetical protein
MSDQFPNEHIYSNELYPLKQVAFEDTTIMVPNNQINVLYRTYSDKCLTACKIANHIALHEFSNKKFMEHRYKLLKSIYSIENRLNIIPRKNTIISFQYKVIKELETQLNNNALFKNNLLNKGFLKSINFICNR